MQIKNLLLTTDFSDEAKKAYAVAGALARRFGALIHLVHVARPMPPFVYLQNRGIDIDMPPEPYLDEFEHRLEREAPRPDGPRPS